MSHTITAQHTHRRTVERTRARRLSTFECVTLVVLTTAIVAVALFGSLNHPDTQVASRSHRVKPGETLWSLAQDNPVPGLDTVATVELIAQMNGLDDSSLHAGSAVLVPAQHGASRVSMR